MILLIWFMTEKEYVCTVCGKKVTIEDGTHPECCGEPMKQLPLDNCKQPHSAEYAGPFEEGEPCDDGR
jgi:hypothetical protein